MELTFVPDGTLQINDARIVFRNFSGAPSQYNREGDRNFALVIPDEMTAEALTDAGWNVKVKPPREEGDTPFMFMAVKVKFNAYGPNCYLVSGHNNIKLDEESVDLLDTVEIRGVNLDIRPYDWEVNGKTGRSAYLQSIQVIQEVDRFASAFDQEEVPFK